MKQYFALGSYTEPILFGTGEVFHGKGKGISVCSFDEGRIEVVREIAVRNPSFVCMDEAHRRIYAVNEMKEYLDRPGGGMTALSYDEAYRMQILGTWNVGGTDPCHIALAPNGRFVVTSNFASGSVSVFPLTDGGAVTGDCTLFQHEGSSAHPKRQRGPHAHSAVFPPDGRTMYVPDLGTDQVVCYRYDSASVASDPSGSLRVPAGSGPRYGEFSADGRHFYLINEIGSQVMHFTFDGRAFTHSQTVSTLPDGFTGDNICSDLHLTPDGALLYASNRGHDSIVCYRVAADGSLSFVSRRPCGGRTPRNFAVDPTGRYLLVGNQDSDCIVVFRIEAGGDLAEVGRMDTGSPVCIRFFRS